MGRAADAHSEGWRAINAAERARKLVDPVRFAPLLGELATNEHAGQLWLISRPSQPKGAPMCFRPAILSLPLLLVFTVAHAQQPSPQNPCFELYRNPSAGIAGALLLNKCSGQTWVLVGTNPARWHPISTEREEYVAPPQR
jgi:hypothetical protein